MTIKPVILEMLQYTFMKIMNTTSVLKLTRALTEKHPIVKNLKVNKHLG